MLYLAACTLTNVKTGIISVALDVCDADSQAEALGMLVANTHGGDVYFGAWKLRTLKELGVTAELLRSEIAILDAAEKEAQS